MAEKAGLRLEHHEDADEVLGGGVQVPPLGGGRCAPGVVQDMDNQAGDGPGSVAACSRGRVTLGHDTERNGAPHREQTPRSRVTLRV